MNLRLNEANNTIRAERDALKARVAHQDEDFALEREDATQWRMACVKAEKERDAAYEFIGQGTSSEDGQTVMVDLSAILSSHLNAVQK